MDTHYSENISLTDIQQERFNKYIQMYGQEMSRLQEWFNNNMSMLVGCKKELVDKITSFKIIDQ